MVAKGSAGGNFFQNLFASLFGSGDPETEKKRRLRGIAKSLSKSHYHFYKTGSEEVLPQFAKLFYEIYKATNPARQILLGMKNDMLIKHVIIEYSLTDNQKKLEEHFPEEAINARAQTVPVSQVAEETQGFLDQFTAEFDADKNEQINELYKNFSAFKDFCCYDFYFLLKKFDSTLKENTFTSQPDFKKVDAQYIVDDLKDFITVAWNLNEKADWQQVMKAFRDMKGVEPVSLGNWKKIVSKMQSLKDSGIFELMIRAATANPDYEAILPAQPANILDSYIDKLRLETMAVVRKLQAVERGSKANDILSQLFGSTAVVYLKNYTEQASQQLEKRKLNTFRYYEALNYVKAFLTEFVKKNIREYCDIVLVRGQWQSTTLSAPMSNAYHELISISDGITVFDESLSEEGSVGIKIKTLLPRIQHDADCVNVINRLVGDANEQAKTYILTATRDVITIGKTIKTLIEDEVKKNSELIINWPEIERASDSPLKEEGVTIYKKIYLFATLIKTCVTPEE